MLKTYQFKTRCKSDIHSSKTANIILPGLMIKQRWTALRLQAKYSGLRLLNFGEMSCFNRNNAVQWMRIPFRLQPNVNFVTHSHASQWENGKFDPLPRPNLLTDRHKKLHTWDELDIYRHAKFSHDPSRCFFSPYARNCASKCLLGFFSGFLQQPTAKFSTENRFTMGLLPRKLPLIVVVAP